MMLCKAPGPGQPCSPQNAYSQLAGPAATRGRALGLCLARGTRRVAVVGSRVGCGRVTSSHWDTASTDSLLQPNPLQTPASPWAVTKRPLRQLGPGPGGSSRAWGPCRGATVSPSSPGATGIPGDAPLLTGAARTHHRSDA